MPHPATAFLGTGPDVSAFPEHPAVLRSYRFAAALGKNRANYRVYSDADRQRLEQICRYRRTGMPLETIAAVLAAPRQKTVMALEQRLDALNREIQGLRAQQQTIVDLLKDRIAAGRHPCAGQAALGGRAPWCRAGRCGHGAVARGL
jgi:DNA-binding transcriptional MerR regulator